MYTEENEFNYDDYLEESLRDTSNKRPFFNFQLILKIILIILCIILVIFLVFKSIKTKHFNILINKELLLKEILVSL